ncbi:MAG: hypothetical protein KDN20_04295 [Verrucomicrobiae bacterium]|nr:hypothetical protein [Verrucomicrobiae bacterium]
MNLARLVLREIRHRKINFALSLLGAALAVAAVLATIGALRSHDLQTEAIISDMEAATQSEMKKLEDEIRKSMKGLGFNIYIFPAGQEMSEVYADGYASKTMPESYVSKLADSKIVTVNHLLPSLTQKLEWPEQKRTIILIGVRGEVPIAHRDPKAPLIDPVVPGHLVLGYELHRSLGLKKGDPVTFMGKEFTVGDAYEARGSKDDITIWMNLGECQELLGKVGLINAIQALECNCATLDRLGEIRAELMQILPDTQIIETQSTALARAEARNQAAATARQQIESKKAQRAQLKAERQKLAGVLLPAATLVSMIWIGLLTFINVRERLPEIGILRAIGVKGRTILGAFLVRAIIAGLVGGAMGAAVAKFVSPTILPKEWLIAICLAPLLAALGAWLPSLAAAQRDPADVLRHD